MLEIFLKLKSSDLASGSEFVPAINTLPRELLEQIFEHVGCAECRISEYQATCKAPDTHTISTVCTLWHDIILSSPFLWRNIYVRGNEDWRPRNEDRLLPHVLRFSKDVDLNITLDFARYNLLDARRKPTESLLPLFAECHRWKTLRISKMISQGSRNDVGFIAEALGTGEASRLHRLRSVVIEVLQDRQMSKALQSAPNIQKLIVFISVQPNQHLQSDEDSSAYPALRTLVADSFSVLSGSKQECWMDSVQTLQMEIDNRCHHPLPVTPVCFDFPSLKILSIAIQRHPYNPIADSRYVSETNTPLLPQEYPSFLTSVLSRISDAPRIRTLILGWKEVQDFRKDRAAPHIQFQPLYAFIERNGGALTQLSIANLFLDPKELCSLLTVIPSLELLKIEEANVGEVGGIWAFNPKLAMITSPFLSFLTVTRDSDIFPEPPLPHLRHIVLVVNEFYDEAFTSMVLSRWTARDSIDTLARVELTLGGYGDLSQTKFCQDFCRFESVILKDRTGRRIVA